MRYIVKTFDGWCIVVPCWRRAKAIMRKAEGETYYVYAKPYRGRMKTGEESWE